MSNPFGISLEKCLSCETNQHPSEHSPLSSLHHASLKPLSFSLSLSLCVLSFTSPTRSSVYWNIARKENPSFHPLSKTRNIRPNETLRCAKIFFWLRIRLTQLSPLKDQSADGLGTLVVLFKFPYFAKFRPNESI